MQNLPRQIDPSLIDVGDTVIISLPRNKGIIHTIQGKVAQIELNNRMATFVTMEGGDIYTWFPGMKTQIKVILIKREPLPEEELFNFTELMEQLRPRLT
jgi:hypothetical protein